MIRISQGLAFSTSAFILGGAAVVFGLLLWKSSFFFISPFLVLIGLAIFFKAETCEIDWQNKRYRFADAYMFLRIGKWEPTENISKIYLDSEINKSGGVVGLVEFNSTSKTYDLAFTMNTGENVILKGYEYYRDAKSMAKVLSDKLNIEIEDNYQKRQRSAVGRRKSMRR